MVHVHCTPLYEIYSPTKFHNHSYYSFGDMLRTKFKYDNKQRAITKKINKQELWFLQTALILDAIYPPTKFHNHSLYSLGDMHRTKFKYKKPKGNNSKIKQARVTVYVHCTPP